MRPPRAAPGQAAPRARPGTARPAPGRPACLALGAAAAALGLLPWLVSGMRLPLQNLWAAPTAPDDMPVALLPFSQYAVTLIACLVVSGYGIAGVVVRRLRRRLPGGAAPWVGAGVLAVHLLATAQTAVTVASGLADRTASAVYLGALLLLVVLAVVTGLLVLRLLSAPPVAGAVLGLGALAVVVGPWLAALLAPGLGAPGEVGSWALNSVVRWVPAVLVGAAIAWGGLGAPSRLAAAAGTLALLWLGPAAFTAVSSAAGSRALLPHPSELLGYGAQVLRGALLAPDLVVPPLLVALGSAAAGLALRRWTARPAARGVA